MHGLWRTKAWRVTQKQDKLQRDGGVTENRKGWQKLNLNSV